MKYRIYVLIILVIFAWSCSGPRYYDLHINPLKEGKPKKIDKILKVDDIETNQTFWHQRMVYRKSTYEVRYFPFKQWAKQPGELIQDTIIHFYKNSQLFARVIDDHSSINPDIVMNTHIDFLEMLYQEEQWHAHLALDIELVDAKSEKTFLSHTFDRKMKIKSKNARYVPEKISLILKEELMVIIDKLKKANQ